MTMPIAMMMKRKTNKLFTLSYQGEQYIGYRIMLITRSLNYIYTNEGYQTKGFVLSGGTYYYNSLANIYNYSQGVTSLEVNGDGSSIFNSGTSFTNYASEHLMSPNYKLTGGYIIAHYLGTNYSQILFGNNGNKIYISQNGNTYEYNLNISYKPYQGYDTPINGTLINTISSLGFFQFNSDGTKLYTVTITNLKEYNLGTAWDISTITFNKDITLGITLSAAGIFNLNDNKLIISTGTIIKIFNII